MVMSAFILTLWGLLVAAPWTWKRELSCATWDEPYPNGVAVHAESDDWGGNPPEPNWPPDWSAAAPPAEDYPYGGAEHRYDAEGPPPDPMDLPVETWAEEDLNSVMASPAYQQPGDPGFEAAQNKVRAWHRHFYGDAPLKRDATGRRRTPVPVRPIPSGGGPVRVRAHARDGGEVSVRAHDRSPPG